MLVFTFPALLRTVHHGSCWLNALARRKQERLYRTSGILERYFKPFAVMVAPNKGRNTGPRVRTRRMIRMIYPAGLLIAAVG